MTMKLSKVDYERIAKALRDVRREMKGPGSSGVPSRAQAVVDVVTDRLAEEFAAWNTRFDRQRFLDASGYAGDRDV